MKKKKVIGIIGEQAGGKGAVSGIIIKNFGGARLRTSDILRRTLDDIYIEFNRPNLIKLAITLKNNFGQAVLMESMLKEVEKTDSDLIVVDGIRMPGDTEPFKREYGNDFKLIYVTADAKVRYERSRARGEKAEEAKASFEEFLAKDGEETEKYIPEVGKTADFTINNDGTKDDLEKRIIEIMEKI